MKYFHDQPSSTVHLFLFFILYRKLQNKYDPEEEELNQYRFSTESLDTLIDNHYVCSERKKHQYPQRQLNIHLFYSISIFFNSINVHSRYRNAFSAGANDISFKDLQHELSVALRDCVRHHYDLIQASKMLEEYFSPFNFIKSLQVTLMLCNVAYTIYMVNSVLLVLFLTYNTFSPIHTLHP